MLTTNCRSTRHILSARSLTGRFAARPASATGMLILVASLAAGCGQSPTGGDAGNLEAIKARGELVVATRNAPTTYYIDNRGRPAGPEHDMATAFAEHVGVDIQFQVLDSIAGVLSAVKSGQADLAAAGLTATESRRPRFAFGPVYQRVTQQVVCRGGGGKRARRVEQLTEVDLAVVADSSYESRLTELRETHPELSWRSVENTGTEQLLHEVWTQEIDCTVADSNIVDINRRYYPELLMMFEISEPEPIAWAMPAGSEALLEATSEWLDSYRQAGNLEQVQDRYYGFIREYDFADKKALHDRLDERYPQYEDLFEDAAADYEVFDDTLLAALAYQESHWNPEARSPTGVRGMMMLTQRTAESLGVENRLDPAQSIAGGARYLHRMYEKVGEDIPQPDRRYLALAAYNVGLYHLRDAQRLAESLGRDPESWADMREVLPLLAEKQYYTDLKYGYARGTEPVHYVRRIRDYRDVIERGRD